MHGSQSCRLASALALARTNESGSHARFSMRTYEHQVAPNARYDSNRTSSGPHTPDSDSAAPTRFNSQGPSTLKPSSCLVRITHTATGIQINANTTSPQVPPALRQRSLATIVPIVNYRIN